MSFTHLPTELQIQIFSYLRGPDLKSARFTCRKFRDNAAPALFQSAVACARYQALGAFQKISLHPVFQTYVKEIVFDGSMYQSYMATSESAHHDIAGAFEGFQSGFSWQRHARYKRYQELFREQEDMQDSGVLLQTVVRALDWMKNITTVVYSPGPHHIPAEAKLMRDVLPRGNLHPTDHLGSRGRGMPSVRPQHAIHQLIGAIYHSSYAGVHEFRAERPRSVDFGDELKLSAFTFPEPVHFAAGKYFFSKLQVLKLNLSLKIHWTDTDGMALISNLAALLSEARGLQELDFHLLGWKNSAHAMYGHIMPHDQPIFPYLGLTTKWSKLTKMSLEGIYATEEELSELITRHKDTLTALRFKYCSLFSGYWANITDDVVYNSKIMPFVLENVNETAVEGEDFRELASSSFDFWQYEGKLKLSRNGQRYFDQRRGTPIHSNSRWRGHIT